MVLAFSNWAQADTWLLLLQVANSLLSVHKLIHLVETATADSSFIAHNMQTSNMHLRQHEPGPSCI